MAGKKKGTGKDGSGWGGAREGAGRPKKEPSDYDAEFRAEVNEAVEKLRKRHKGKSYIQAAIEMVYDKKQPATARAAIFSKLADINTVRRTESKSEISDFSQNGPTIYKTNDRGEIVVTRRGSTVIALPAQLQDPALEVVDGGKKGHN